MGQLLTIIKKPELVRSVEELYEGDLDSRRTKIYDEITGMGYPTEVQNFNCDDYHGCNIVSAIPRNGNGEWEVVISAHYDGDGAYDNAGGVTALLELMNRLRGYPSSRTLKYVFFDGEERGQLGSTAYLRNRKNRINVVKNVNIDGCGIGDRLVEVRRSYPFILDDGDVEVVHVASDSSIFKCHGIPATWYATLPSDEAERLQHLIMPPTWTRVHSHDNMTGINEDDLQSAVDAIIGEIKEI